MLACFRCRAEIPGDSQFCPLCGAKTADVDGSDTQRDDYSLGEGPTDLAEAPVPAPDRRTMVMAPAQGPGAPVQQHGPPIPYAWAPPTPPSAPIPAMIPPGGGMASAIPMTPSPGRIGIGVMLALVAVIMAVWLVPRLGDDVTAAGRLVALVVGLVAIVFIVFGLRHRAHAEVVCRMCRRPVVAWKGAFGLHCPLGPHQARIDWPMVVLTVGFWSGALLVAIVGAVLFL